MKELPKTTDKQGKVSLRLLMGIAIVGMLPAFMWAQVPTWWGTKGVTVQNGTANDYAAVNQGQLKQIATAAYEELEANAPGGAGDLVTSLINNWSRRPDTGTGPRVIITGSNTNDYAALNLGQLKTVAAPFYARLKEIHYVDLFPWEHAANPANDYAMANIGQVKNLFSFDLRTPNAQNDKGPNGTAGNGLPDWWEKYYFGQIVENPDAPAPRNDGLTIRQAFEQKLDPLTSASAIISANPSPISITLFPHQSGTQTLALINSTAQPVQYSIALTDNLVEGNDYSVKDSKTGNVPFVWEDISVTGTRLNEASTQDDGSEAVNLTGFSFPFYGQNFSTIYVSSNGQLTFGAGTDIYENTALPSVDAPRNLIAPLWDDLLPEEGGDIYYKEESGRLIVQYQNIVTYEDGQDYTFQVVLSSDGTIEFRYLQLLGGSDSCTVGLLNADGTDGLQIAYNEAYLENNMAIRIRKNALPFVEVAPLSGTIAAGGSTQLDVIFHTLNLPLGSYTANIQVFPTGSETPSVIIPAIMEVVKPPVRANITAPYDEFACLEGQAVAFRLELSGGIIQDVVFYDGETQIDSGPYDVVDGTKCEFVWTGLTVGSHSITARITTQDGEVVTSPAVEVIGVPDTDRDGMSDDWELRNGINPLNADDAYANPRGDGYPNIYKYTHGIDLQSEAIPAPDIIVDPNAGSNPPSGTFTTISAAIAALTHDYQIIQVLPGTYNEQISLYPKKAMLISRDGPEATVIQGTNGREDQRLLATFVDCVIKGFKMSYNSGDTGGGICCYSDASSGNVLILDCIIENCSLPGWGAGVYFHSVLKASVSNCIFRNNYTGEGGAAIGVYNSHIAVSFCTFINNSADVDKGAIFNYLGTVQISNSILWDTRDSQIYSYDPSKISVSYSDIKGGWLGTGNIDANPLLSPEGRLAETSPCRARGNRNSSYQFDIDGETRINPPDLGADQYVPITNILPIWWKWLYFHSTDIEPEADQDGDGISNLNEARAGTNPTDFYNNAAPTIIKISGDHQIPGSQARLPEPLVVSLSNNCGMLSNAPVRFEVAIGSASLGASGSDPGASSFIVVKTGPDGIARAYVEIPVEPGPDLVIHVTPGTGNYDAAINFSVHFAATSAPSSPSRLSGTAQGGLVNLDWIDESDNESGFVIERSADGGNNWNEIGCSEANSTSYHDSVPNAGPLYIYRVSAANEAGRSAPTNIISFKGTDPETADSDGDGMPDGWEFRNGLNPLNSDDAYENPSGDGYPNFYKFIHGIDLLSGSTPPPDFIVDPNAGPNPPAGTFTTISEAIAALTQDYKIIQLLPGIYYENIWLNTSKVMLISRDGPQSTVIHGVAGSGQNIINCVTDSVLVGLNVGHETGDYGGGVGFYEGGDNEDIKRAALIKCIITNCRQPNYYGAGLWFASSWHASLVNCIFRNNLANRGGALGNSGAIIKISNCTFVNNIAGDVGDAIYNGSGVIKLSNSIVWGANCGPIAGNSAQTIVDHSVVKGGSAGIGNLDVDPGLSEGGFLTNLSPCRGIADVSSATSLDIDGNARGEVPDIGADQFVEITDNLPNWWKTKYFSTNAVDPGADVDGDGITNLEEARNGTDPIDFFNGFSPTISKISGDNQLGESDCWLPEPLVVSVLRNSGSIAGMPVRFETVGGNGQLALDVNSPTSSSLVAISGTDGTAKVYVRCPTTSGTNIEIHALAGSNSCNVSVTFKAQLTPRAPSNLLVIAQDRSCHLEWTDNSSNESGFVIERSDDECITWTEIKTVNANTTSFDDYWVYLYSGLSVYRVSAACPGGHSAFSNHASSMDGIDSEHSFADADGDGYPDVYELARATNPYSSESIPPADFVVDQSGTTGTYQSIQSAIDAAQQDHKIIKVCPGIYYENLVIATHNILLISSSGAATTIINGSAAGSVITVNNDSSIFGFSIINGLASQNGVLGNGGGIFIQGGSPRFTNCVIMRNEAVTGAAVYNTGINPMLSQCTIANNTTTPNSPSNASIANTSGTLNIINSIIWNSTIAVELSGTGFNVSDSSVRNSSFNSWNSWTPTFRADGHLSSSSPWRCGNLIAPTIDMDGEKRDNMPSPGADEYTDNDENEIADWWETRYFGKIGLDPNAFARSDGLTISQAYSEDIDVTDYYFGEPSKMTVVSGEGLVAPLGDLVPVPFIVKVSNQNGNLLPNAPVTFHAAEGDIRLAAVKNVTYTEMQTVRTGTDGTAQVYMKMPNYRGTPLSVFAECSPGIQVSISVAIAPPSPPSISPSKIMAQMPITLSSPAPGAVIYYTIDGSEPTLTSSSVQSGGKVMITTDCVLNAKVVDQYSQESLTVEKQCTLTGQVVTNGYAVYALRTDGSVWRWPMPDPFAASDVMPNFMPVQVQGLQGIVQLACGSRTVALTGSGSVFQIIDDMTGGNTVAVQVMADSQTPLTNVVCVAADTTNHCHAVLRNGSVMYWGDDYTERVDYQNPFNYKKHDYPTKVKGLADICDLKCDGSDLRDIPTTGATLYTALRKDGTVVTWGSQYYYHHGIGWIKSYLEPSTVDGLTDIVRIAAGGNQSFATNSEGIVKAWGVNDSDNPLGNISFPDIIYTSDMLILQPIIIPRATNFIQIEPAGRSRKVSRSIIEAQIPPPGQTAAISADGNLWTWGHGYRGDGATVDILNYVEEHTGIQKNPFLSNLAGVTLGGPDWNFGIATAKDGTLWTWGRTGLPPTGINLIPVRLAFKVKNWQTGSSGGSCDGTVGEGGTDPGGSTGGSETPTPEVNVSIISPENGTTIP